MYSCYRVIRAILEIAEIKVWRKTNYWSNNNKVMLGGGGGIMPPLHNLWFKNSACQIGPKGFSHQIPGESKKVYTFNP